MADEKRIAEIMKSLGLTREETIEMLQDDDDIDHNKPKSFDLSPEQHKIAQKYAKSPTHKRTEGKIKRERKPNEAKRLIIAQIFDFLSKNDEISAENVTITNIEKLITFSIGEDDFEVNLIQKRKPKPPKN